MQESANPYSVSSTPLPEQALRPHGDKGMFAQIMVVGILQTVVGGLELAVGGMLVVMIALIISQSPAPASALIVQGGIAAVVTSSAFLRIISGIGSFYFRYRGLFIFSLAYGFITALTCYCAVSSVAVGVYGLIVVLSSTAQRAYAMKAAGMSPQEIRAAFRDL